jgi:hypothetical protein
VFMAVRDLVALRAILELASPTSPEES